MFALAGVACAAPGRSAAQASNGISILTGEFGTLGAKRKLSIIAPLQKLCGSESDSCSVFCSETSFGRYNVGRRPICRVTFRCSDQATRAVEAAKEELIVLRCEDEQAKDASEQQAPVEQLQPPPYVPPQGN